MESYLKVETYIPQEYVKPLVTALNDEGLLVDNGYDFVFCQTEVTGHFRPLDGASPFSGQVGEISKVPEIKLEFRIKSSHKEKCQEIMLANHPYEVAVINFIRLL